MEFSKWSNDGYEKSGYQTCITCKGEGFKTVYGGSIHDPQDPVSVKCGNCRGKGMVTVLSDEEAH
jgi:DnaJ-class molecular chaperone